MKSPLVCARRPARRSHGAYAPVSPGERRLWMAMACLVAGLARAEAPVDRVELGITGPEAESSQLQASVQELLSRLGLKTSGEDGLLARVSVRLSGEDCQVTVIDAKGAVATSRTLRRREEAQLTVEAVAYIIQSAVEALADLQRNPLGRPPEVTPPPIVTLPVKPRALPPPPVRVELGAQLTGRAFASDQLFVLGGGLVVSARPGQESRWAPRLSLLLGYNAPFHGGKPNGPVQLNAQTFSPRLLAGARLLGDEAWSLEAQVGGGLDAMFTSTQVGSELFTHDRVDVSPILTALLAGHHRLTAATDVFLMLSADLDLLPHQYVANVLGLPQHLYDAWRVRPGLALGFTFELTARASP